MNFIGKLLGIKPEKVVDSVGNVLDNLITNKEELAAAKLAVQQEANRHLEAISTAAENMEKAYLADIDSARKMQAVALGQDDKFSKRYVYYLSSFVIVSATAFGILLFYVDFPESNRRLVEMFADIYLFAGAIMVLQFFFGSSKGSQDKDVLLKQMKP